MSKDLGQYSDAELLAKVQMLSGQMTEAPVNLGMTAADAVELEAEMQNYAIALNEWNIVQDEYDSKQQAKKAARESLIALLRIKIKQIKANPKLTPTQLEAA